ncbi:DUF3087 family protein [Halopseudomonas salina]|uniref:DUF3087 domain-containing protein n=1 Tax=Halopseudomonas salina TaxID=1323744 RepID=A0ABQ1P4V3_9GAMM|nr:DUF3087 family protein [Halopseudomonas salina]GGC91065.1 hypothetical protein GCM10007418_08430 [Halopseudomonas salina]
MFEIQHLDPQRYRQQTRKSTLVIVVIFAVLAMSLSALAVALFGSTEGSNFRWNLGGVLLGVALTIVLVRYVFWHQSWMQPAVYGWQLKRSLMSVTNVMHQVEAGVQAGLPEAMKLLRFYHLGQVEMHRLDGHPQAADELSGPLEKHRQAMLETGLSIDQYRLDPAWLASLQQRKPDTSA